MQGEAGRVGVKDLSKTHSLRQSFSILMTEMSRQESDMQKVVSPGITCDGLAPQLSNDAEYQMMSKHMSDGDFEL